MNADMALCPGGRSVSGMPLGAYCDIVTPFSQSIAFSGGLAGPEELKRTVVCFSLGLSPDRRVWRDSRERTPAEMAWQDSRTMGSGRTVGRGAVRLFTWMSRAATWSGWQVGFHTSFVLACFHMVTRYLSHSPVKELEYCFLAALI